MQLHDHLDGGQSQSLSAGGTGSCVRTLIETLKDALLLVKRDTTTGIPHLKNYHILVFGRDALISIRLYMSGDRDLPTCRSKTQSITEQVAYHLLHAHLVGKDGRKSIGNIDGQRNIIIRSSQF